MGMLPGATKSKCNQHCTPPLPPSSLQAETEDSLTVSLCACVFLAFDELLKPELHTVPVLL